MKDQYKVIGLMSGTSLDGLDLANCSFSKTGDVWKFDFEHCKGVEYDQKWRDKLKNSINLGGVDILLLHNEYGRWLGQQVKEFINEHGLQPDLVSSHGHTVFHQPEKDLTFQLGSGIELANTCGITTICDFRSLDVALGGQGAPLVPIGDQLLFSEYDFCLNLGGIANLSCEFKGERIAFDICAANMLLNHLCHQIGKKYDFGGQIARSGKLDRQLLADLNSVPYHKQPFPKSTGYEWFQSDILPLMERSFSSVEDKLRTAAEHIAHQVSEALLPFSRRGSRLLATGGGAKNTFLMELISEKCGKDIEVVIPDEMIIDFKEALVFGLMGVLRLRGEINCLKSVTGAVRDSCGGVVYENG